MAQPRSWRDSIKPLVAEDEVDTTSTQPQPGTSVSAGGWRSALQSIAQADDGPGPGPSASGPAGSWRTGFTSGAASQPPAQQLSPPVRTISTAPSNPAGPSVVAGRLTSTGLTTSGATSIHHTAGLPQPKRLESNVAGIPRPLPGAGGSPPNVSRFGKLDSGEGLRPHTASVLDTLPRDRMGADEDVPASPLGDDTARGPGLRAAGVRGPVPSGPSRNGWRNAVGAFDAEGGAASAPQQPQPDDEVHLWRQVTQCGYGAREQYNMELAVPVC